ncbi:MAG: protein-disulfide reductase DsbD domain-containing protein [Verrucomicrobiota bacterium]
MTVPKFIVIFALLFCGFSVRAQTGGPEKPVEASLLADTTAVIPGKPFTAGLLLKMKPGWHTYWRDPGDSGLATSLQWDLPPGFHAGEIEWPAPLKKIEPGDFKVNVYEGEVLLLVKITPPAQMAGDSVTLRCKAAWLVCRESCIPGSAELSLTLPVAKTGIPANAELFQKYRALLPAAETSQSQPATPAPPHPAKPAFLKYLVFAFLGGLLLNIMPCVLPVITIKIYGFINQAGQSRRRILQLGLAYCAGVFAWFLGLAALIILFGLNWSFQFQSKAFVAAMLLICLLFGLNLIGLFEFMLPGSLNTKLVAMTSKEGAAGAFVHGLFATLLGSACTAPLLGPAVGFALAQPPPVVFAVFAAIATGMALPYFLLTLNPGWLRFLPKPGMWMVRIKQVMGLLVLATAAWFGFILFHQLTAKPDAFPQKLEAALKSGRMVFVDFTAEWCINCKVNEKTVINSAAVQRAFKEDDVEFLRADWTNGNSEITRLLKQFGRAGVPLYVIYPAGGAGEPVVLPELLTQQMVLDGLASAKRKP